MTRQTTPPIRVGFVVHVMQVAGAEVLVTEIIRRLGSRIIPTVFCLDAVGRLGHELQAHGTEVVAFGRRPGLDLRVAWRLGRAASARSLQVLHAHQYTPFFYAALGRFAAALHYRLIFTEHGRHYPDVVPTRRRIINRVLFDRLANDVNAVCEFSARSLMEKDGFTRTRPHVIENGIDLSRYQGTSRESARRTLGLAQDRQYIICVARFHPVKDHITLLRAFATVADSRPNVDLLLVGDGETRAEIEGLARQLSIESRVHFLGIRGDVALLLNAADVFAMTSLSEASSITLLEAMASGLPVVVTNVGGNPELVRQGVDGFLVDRGDATQVAAALSALLDNRGDAEAKGRSGKAWVAAHHNLEETVAQYMKLYEALGVSRRTRERRSATGAEMVEGSP